MTHPLSPARADLPDGVKISVAARLLVLDHTRIGGHTASGELKANVLADWPPADLLQLYDAGNGRLGLHGGVVPDGPASELIGDWTDLHDHVTRFRPQVILYRPVPRSGHLHVAAMQLIHEAALPLVVWIADDWPTAQLAYPAADRVPDADLHFLLLHAAARFSISDAMSDAFAERYGYQFEAYANGVDASDWQPLREPQPGQVVVRYAGSLGDDLRLDSVLMVAEAVEALATSGTDMVMEIRTREFWRRRSQVRFAGLARTTISVSDLATSDYRLWLAGADVVLIAYNFDETSKRRVRYSLANKLPECLACGAALLAVGPPDIATIELLQDIDCGILVTKPDPRLLQSTLGELAASPQLRLALATKARREAFARFDINSVRARFAEAIARVAESGPVVPGRSPATDVEASTAPATAVAAPPAPQVTDVRRPLYAPFGDWLKPRFPRLYRALRMSRRATAAAWRRRSWTVPLAGLSAIIVLLPLLPDLADWRPSVWTVTAIAGLFLGLLFLAYRVHGATALAVTEAAAQARLLAATQHRVAEQAQTVDELRRTASRLSAELEADRAAHATAAAQFQMDAEKSAAAVRRLQEQVAAAELEADRSAQATAAAQFQIDAEKNAAAVRRLRERVVAAERQLGNVRYPDAPRCIVLFGHHKCASNFFRNEVFAHVAEMTGSRVRRYRIDQPPFHYSRSDDLDLSNMDFADLGHAGREVVLFSNATERSLAAIRQFASDWRGVRVLRDPRQVLVSSYLNHKGRHATELNGWVWDTLVRDQPILRGLPEEEGILYELDHISKEVIETQLLGEFDDPRILTIKLEEFAGDPAAHLQRTADFLQVADIAGIDLSRTHANPDGSPWQALFTPRIRSVFKQRYGQALIDLGYEQDLDW